ncbi:MAG: hypothetical protein RBU37_16300 [Myxococcota bacterium]|jgi:hypothetical protein|nr:hypothetical protein [Myxococcota bacterium]
MFMSSVGTQRRLPLGFGRCLVLLGLIAAGCTDTESVCPSDASTCPSDCASVYGSRIVGACFVNEVVGCELPGSGGVSTGAATCGVRLRDGAVIKFSNTTTGDGNPPPSPDLWGPCTNEQRTMAFRAKPCAPE